MTPAVAPPPSPQPPPDGLSLAMRVLALSRHLVALRREAANTEREIEALLARMGEA